MRELLSKIAIVREQKQSFTLRVQASDVEEARELRRQQIENRVARVRIASRGNKPRRLVQRDCQRLFEMNELAIDFDVIALARLRAEVRADAAVDRHSTGRDQFVTFAARANAGGGEKTI